LTGVEKSSHPRNQRSALQLVGCWVVGPNPARVASVLRDDALGCLAQPPAHRLDVTVQLGGQLEQVGLLRKAHRPLE